MTSDRVTIEHCLFDLYGTLLDLGGLRRAIPAELDPDAVIATWRAKQLEYSWTHALMGRHASFEALAERALDWTLAAHEIDRPAVRDTFRIAYGALSPHPDAESCLRELRQRGLPCSVLSNGSQRAIEDALTSSGLAPLITRIVSVESLETFKPDPRVYQAAARLLNVAPEAVAFQSANAWDAAGAASAGFTVQWINRGCRPDEYDLGGRVTELASLDELSACLNRPAESQ